VGTLDSHWKTLLRQKPDSSSEPSATSAPTLPEANMLALLLAGLAMFGPFSVDSYLPAFDNIQQTLHATPLEVQQTLTAYMMSFGMMMLWHGSLSDAFGRRKVILVSLAVFAIATLGCAASQNVQYLWIFRVLQGLAAGAGVVVGRAIVRDVYAGVEATQMLSLVTMIFSIAPALAPIFGGWIVKLSNWRTIFEVIFIYTLMIGWIAWKHLPETLPAERRIPFRPGILWHNYLLIFRSAPLQLMAGVIAGNFSGMFLYIAASPAFVMQHLKLGADGFGWQFVPQVGGIFCGALAANRLAGKITLPAQIGIGFIFLIAAAAFAIAYHAVFPPALPWSVAPLFFYTFGMSIVSPCITLLMLDLFPHIRGFVASYQSFSMIMLASLVSAVAAPTLSASPLLLAVGQLVFTLAGLACWLALRRRTALQ
jgi:DHA1 family bicyclomycin/chloramphenicol resistance-like MFS transporter